MHTGESHIFFGQRSVWVNRVLLFFLLIYQAALVYTLPKGPARLQDSVEYLNSSNSFRKYGNFYAGEFSKEVDYRLYSKRTPFYPLLIFALYVAHLHQNYLMIIQLFVGLFNIFLAFWLLKQWVPEGKVPVLLLTVFILLTPSQFIYSQMIMADIWLQLFVMLMAVSLVRYHQKPGISTLMWIIIWATLAALAKPVFLPASFLIALGVCIAVFRNHSKFAVLLALIPVFSWLVIASKNEKHTGVFHYSSIGYINLLHYNTNLFLVHTRGHEAAAQQLGPLMDKPVTRNMYQKHYRQVSHTCMEIIGSAPLAYAWYHAKGMVYFFMDPGRFDLYNFFRLEKGNSKGFLHEGGTFSKFAGIIKDQPLMGTLMLAVLLFNVLKTIGFAGFIWTHRKDWKVGLLALAVIYFSFMTGPLGASRFALPVALIIIIFATAFYTALVRKRFSRLDTQD